MTEKKFEVGQVWLTKYGEKRTIVKIDGPNESYPIVTCDEDGICASYTIEGTYWLEEESDDDLHVLKSQPVSTIIGHSNSTVKSDESIREDYQSKPTSLTVQEGGDHYKTLKIQPVEYIVANGLDFLEGNVVKYITRHKQKNGAQDIKKVIHYCNLILDLRYGNSLTSQESTGKITNPAN